MPAVALSVALLSVMLVSATALARTGRTTWHATWSVPGGDVFTDVSCGDASHCIAVGYGSTAVGASVFGSTDGGSTWSAELPPAGMPPLISVSCPTAAFCLASGVQGLTGALMVTSNGGTTWHLLAPPSDGSGGLDAVDCVTTAYCAGIGFAGGPAFFASTDSGHRWTTTQLPVTDNVLQQIFGLACVSVSTCFVVVTNQSTQAGPIVGTAIVYRTTDGGAHFTKVASASADGFGPLPISCDSTSVCMVPGTGSYSNGVDITTDGGTTWTNETLPSPIVEALGVGCANSECAVPVMTSTPGLSIATLMDGGTTWVTTPVAPLAGSNLMIGGIACPTAGACVLAGFASPDGSLARQASGTWTDANVASGPPPVGAAACASPSHCVAVGNGSAWFSNDGGLVWSPSSSSPVLGNDDLAAIVCPIPTGCVAVGSSFDSRTGNENGVALRSLDDGRSWHPLVLPKGTPSLTSISCMTSTTCVATASPFFGGPPNASIIRTTDRGTLWHHTAAPKLGVFDGLASVSCGSATTCVAVGAGESPFALSSNDAGLVWHITYEPNELGQLLTVSCTSATSCWAGGNAGFINQGQRTPLLLRTSTLGKRWLAAPTPGVFSDVTSISCIPSVCHLAGVEDTGSAVELPVVATSVDRGHGWSLDALPSTLQEVAGFAERMPSYWLAVGVNALNGPIVMTNNEATAMATGAAVLRAHAVESVRPSLPPLLGTVRVCRDTIGRAGASAVTSRLGTCVDEVRRGR